MKPSAAGEQEVSRCEAIIRDSISRYFPDSALYDQ